MRVVALSFALLAWTGAAAASCGDGVLSEGEQCDDGNAVSDDGCSSSCTVETCWRCRDAPSQCAPFLTPPDILTCAYEPYGVGPSGTLRIAVAARGTYSFDWHFESHRFVTFADVDAAAFPDPTITPYTFCVFDGRRRILAATIPSGALCGTRPCWRKRPTGGFAFRDGGQTFGVRRIRLSPARLTGLTVALDGRALTDRIPDLPVGAPNGPLIAQLHGGERCWQAFYQHFIGSNDERRFRGRAGTPTCPGVCD